MKTKRFEFEEVARLFCQQEFKGIRFTLRGVQAIFHIDGSRYCNLLNNGLIFENHYPNNELFLESPFNVLWAKAYAFLTWDAYKKIRQFL